MVYLAEDEKLDRKVAIKLLDRYLVEKDPNFLARFKREAKTAASLDHPNIVKIYDVVDKGEDSFLVIQYIDGTSLTDVLKRNNKLTLNEASSISINILDALTYAHEKGVVHRDIKPSNILIDKKGKAFLSDFGIAKALNGEKLTTTGSTIGTPEYMSPEQASGKPIDFRSDLYSFGILLYEMLSGDVPFRSDTPVAVAIKHINEAIPNLDNIMSEIPEKVKSVISNLLAKEPGLRTYTIEEIIKILGEYKQASLTQNNDIASEAKTIPIANVKIKDETENLTLINSKTHRKSRYLIPAIIAVLLIVGLLYGLPVYNLIKNKDLNGIKNKNDKAVAGKKLQSKNKNIQKPEINDTAGIKSTAKKTSSQINEKAIGYIKAVYDKNGQHYLDIDYIQWLEGEAAVKAVMNEQKISYKKAHDDVYGSDEQEGSGIYIF